MTLRPFAAVAVGLALTTIALPVGSASGASGSSIRISNSRAGDSVGAPSKAGRTKLRLDFGHGKILVKYIRVRDA